MSTTNPIAGTTDQLKFSASDGNQTEYVFQGCGDLKKVHLTEDQKTGEIHFYDSHRIGKEMQRLVFRLLLARFRSDRRKLLAEHRCNPTRWNKEIVQNVFSYYASRSRRIFRNNVSYH
jgi:hypothetical protein